MNPEIIIIPTSSSNYLPQVVLLGEEANLEAFRSSTTTRSAQEILEHHRVTSTETLLLLPQQVQVTWQTQDSTILFTNRKGQCLITTERILFIDKYQNTNDFMVHATCLELHAISDNGIYIQLQKHDSSDSIELTITPCLAEHEDEDETFKHVQCQQLFQALTQLVSLHPIPLDDNDNDEEEYYGFSMSEDAIIAPPASATPQERQAMLERLDNMLLVPPEYQILENTAVQGQFDDASEEKHEQDDDDDTDEKLL